MVMTALARGYGKYDGLTFSLRTGFAFSSTLCIQPSDICELTPVGYRADAFGVSGRFVAKVSSGDVPTSISREYQELSRGLYGFRLDSVAYWLPQ